MAKLTPLEELDVAIRLAATDADSSTRSREVAREFYESNRELIAEAADEWIIEKLAVLIARHRAKVRRENDRQLVLEGTLGFARLPKRMKDRAGRSVFRSDATTPFFRKLVADLRKAKSPALEEAERALGLIQAYSKQRGVRTTWSEVLEREAEAAKKAKKKAGN